MHDSGRSSMRAPSLLVVVLVSAIVAGLLTVGLTTILDRFDRPSIVVEPSAQGDVVIQVDGAVATPGVYTLPPNARLIDVIAASGGLAANADMTTLNLASRLGDGESITIPELGAASQETQATAPVASTSVAASAGRININSASAAELEELPGIGPVLASRIVESRTQEGTFASVDDLIRIKGISQSMVEELAPLISVDD